MKQEDSHCPRCRSRRIVLGELARGIGPAEAFRFRAFASRLTFLRRGARMQPNVAACIECGLLWGQLGTSSLREHLESLPTAEVAKWLRSEHDTPI